MNYIDTHKNRIRESAKRNPLKAYFLGGFETLPPKLQKETIRFLNKCKRKKLNETKGGTRCPSGLRLTTKAQAVGSAHGQ